MSNVNNRGNGNGGRNRKRNRSGNQPRAQPAQKKQKRKRAGRGANSVQGGNSAFSAPELHFAPIAIGAKMKKTKPIFTRSADEQRIVHREKIAKLVSGGTGAFAVLRTIALNPGVAASFPWLANEAAGYESYRFNRLRFVWVPSIGAAVAGNVIMGPDYDPSDAAPSGETALSSYTDSDEERVWAPLAVECNPAYLNSTGPRKYVRNGTLATGSDIKMYDSGNFFVAVTDDAAAQTGKLWVEYDVTLLNPQVPPGGFFQNATMTGSTALTSALPFGTAGTEVIKGSPSISVSGLVITLTGMVIGQQYTSLVQLTGTVESVLTQTITSGGTANIAKPSMVNAAATEMANVTTFNCSSETVVITLAVTATSVTASRYQLSVQAPSAF